MKNPIHITCLELQKAENLNEGLQKARAKFRKQILRTRSFIKILFIRNEFHKITVFCEILKKSYQKGNDQEDDSRFT